MTVTEDEVYRDPAATDREARRAVRTQRRGETGDAPVVPAPSRKPLASQTQTLLNRLIGAAGLVAVGIAVAVLLDGSPAWLVGLVVALVTIVLSTLLQSPPAGPRSR